MQHDPINHPQHYTSGFQTRPIECIDIAKFLSFRIGNAFKYVWRSGLKGGPEKEIEDLQKALWYLQNILDDNLDITAPIELEKAKQVFNFIAHKENDWKYKALDYILIFNLPYAKEVINNRIQELTQPQKEQNHA